MNSNIPHYIKKVHRSQYDAGPPGQILIRKKTAARRTAASFIP